MLIGLEYFYIGLGFSRKKIFRGLTYDFFQVLFISVVNRSSRSVKVTKM